MQAIVFISVCLTLQLGSLAPNVAGATGSRVQTQPVSQIVNSLVSITIDGTVLRMPMLLNLPLEQKQANITRAIIVVHGALRNAQGAFSALQRAAAVAGEAGHQALIMAPQFLSEVDGVRDPVPFDVPVWSVDGWKDGSLSEIRRDDSTDYRVSSFAVLDALLQMLSRRERWPSLRLIVVAGHSAGAQFVQRYAAAGRAPTEIGQRDIRTRFLVANPSSYLYFDDRRPVGQGFTPFPRTGCPTFDRYKYGMETPNAYVESQSAPTLMRQYAMREVIYLLGSLDADAAHPFLDHSCAAEAQGPTRLARGKAYYRYLPLALGPEVVQQHHLVLVDGVGHDHQGMFQSPCGMAWLFADGHCPSPPEMNSATVPGVAAHSSVPTPRR